MKDLLLGIHVVVKTLNFGYFHVIVWQTTSKNSTEMRAARAARLFFHIYPIRSLFLASSLPLPSLLKLPVVSMKRVFCYLLCEMRFNRRTFYSCRLGIYGAFLCWMMNTRIGNLYCSLSLVGVRRDSYSINFNPERRKALKIWPIFVHLNRNLKQTMHPFPPSRLTRCVHWFRGTRTVVVRSTSWN